MPETATSEVYEGNVAAYADVIDAVRREPTYTNHCRACERLRAGGVAVANNARRVALLSNFTVDPVVTCLVVQGHLNGVPLDPYVGPYGEYAQQILDETSGLHRFGADVVVIALTAEAVMPALFR